MIQEIKQTSSSLYNNLSKELMISQWLFNCGNLLLRNRVVVQEGMASTTPRVDISRPLQATQEASSLERESIVSTTIVVL